MSRLLGLLIGAAAVSGETFAGKTLVQRVGEAFYRMKPPINTEPDKYQVWSRHVVNVANEMAQGRNLCDHTQCIARRRKAFVDLCSTGKWPEDTPIAAASQRGHFDVIDYLSGHSNAKPA